MATEGSLESVLSGKVPVTKAEPVVIAVEVDWTLATQLRALRALTLRSRVSIAPFVLLPTLAVAAWLLDWSRSPGSPPVPSLSQLVLLFLLPVVVLLTSVISHLVRPQTANPVHFFFDGEGIRIHRGSPFAFPKWSEVRSLQFAHGFLLMHTGLMTHHALPLSAIPSGHALESILALARRSDVKVLGNIPALVK